MQLFVKGQQTHVFEVSENSSFVDLKNFILSKEGISFEDQVIYSQGHVLDQELFSELSEGSQIEVLTRLLGGKVHGSLARAGKVKGQTPKVEKQTKKRKKCGRARRRILFLKRFVNEVATNGKKRGPNANVKS